MFKSKSAYGGVFCSIFSIVLLLIGLVGFVRGDNLIPGMFCGAAVFLMGCGQRIAGLDQGKEENLGRLAAVKDLSIGLKCVVGKSPNGQVFIGGTHASGCHDYLHSARAFDLHSVPDFVLAREINDMPVGVVIVVKRESGELVRA